MPPRCASCGEATATRACRRTRSRRRPWRSAPVRILIMVDLPAPFWPISACTSAGRTSSEAPLRAGMPREALVDRRASSRRARRRPPSSVPILIGRSVPPSRRRAARRQQPRGEAGGACRQRGVSTRVPAGSRLGVGRLSKNAVVVDHPRRRSSRPCRSARRRRRPSARTSGCTRRWRPSCRRRCA